MNWSDLRQLFLDQQAQMDPSHSTYPIALNFPDPQRAWQATQTGVALWHRSHWGRLLIQGSGTVDYLHSQTTNDIKRLQPSQGCDTVFVTSTAHIVDLVTVYQIGHNEMLLLTSPDKRQSLQDWIRRLLVFSRGTTLTDVSDTGVCFTVIGPQSQRLLSTLGVSDDILTSPLHSQTVVTLAGSEVRLAVGSTLTLPGYTLLGSVENAVNLWKTLVDAGAVPMGETTWEQARIQDGRPASPELIEKYNPLEAGLWNAVSLTKGCYIGQEVLAKQTTYQRLRQRLWRFEVQETPLAPGDALMLDDHKVGTITSWQRLPNRQAWALGVVSTKVSETELRQGGYQPSVPPYLSFSPEVLASVN